MENCTIYSHYLNFDKVVEIVKKKLPKAKVEFNDGGINKSLVATIKGGFFGKNKTLKINYRQRENPSYRLEEVECGLTQNLAGMANFIQSLPTQNEAVKSKFLHKVLAANCEMPFMAEPEIIPEFKSVLQDIIQELDAYIFAQPSNFFNKSNGQHFLDKNFDLILDANGNCEIQDIEVNVEAKYHDVPEAKVTDEQLNRKSKSENFLNSHGIKVNKNLPCVEAVEETKLRSVEEIIERAYALLVTAAKGEGIEQSHLDKLIQDKKIDSLSPKESEIFQMENLNDQDRAYATWRYESLYVILWTLGKMDHLKFPSEICDVQAIVGALIKTNKEELKNSVQLKTTSEILDELDKTYRMNWVCVDARIKGQQVEGNINSSIIFERHFVLNWLTNYQNQDWDNVTTDT
ncbi:MAG: DUF4272 domain-containing protein [Saprospiraceae bacterium]